MLSTSEVEKGIAAGESCAADNQMLARAEVEKGKGRKGKTDCREG